MLIISSENDPYYNRQALTHKTHSQEVPNRVKLYGRQAKWLYNEALQIQFWKGMRGAVIAAIPGALGCIAVSLPFISLNRENLWELALTGACLNSLAAYAAESSSSNKLRSISELLFIPTLVSSVGTLSYRIAVLCGDTLVGNPAEVAAIACSYFFTCLLEKYSGLSGHFYAGCTSAIPAAYYAMSTGMLKGIRLGILIAAGCLTAFHRRKIEKKIDKQCKSLDLNPANVKNLAKATLAGTLAFCAVALSLTTDKAISFGRVCVVGGIFSWLLSNSAYFEVFKETQPAFLKLQYHTIVAIGVLASTSVAAVVSIASKQLYQHSATAYHVANFAFHFLHGVYTESPAMVPWTYIMPVCCSIGAFSYGLFGSGCNAFSYASLSAFYMGLGTLLMQYGRSLHDPSNDQS